MMPWRTSLIAITIVGALVHGCRAGRPVPSATTVSDPLSAAESSYHDLRYLKDQIDIANYRGATRSTNGETLLELLRGYKAKRPAVAALIEALPTASFGEEDQRALATMRRTMENELIERAGCGRGEHCRE